MPSWEAGGEVHSKNNDDDVMFLGAFVGGWGFIPTTTTMMSPTEMKTTKMTTKTPICNNQPCGRMHFRQRGDGVVSTTMAMSKTTRTSHDKYKDYNQEGGWISNMMGAFVGGRG